MELNELLLYCFLLIKICSMWCVRVFRCGWSYRESGCTWKASSLVEISEHSYQKRLRNSMTLIKRSRRFVTSQTYLDTCKYLNVSSYRDGLGLQPELPLDTGALISGFNGMKWLRMRFTTPTRWDACTVQGKPWSIVSKIAIVFTYCCEKQLWFKVDEVYLSLPSYL